MLRRVSNLQTGLAVLSIKGEEIEFPLFSCNILQESIDIKEVLNADSILKVFKFPSFNEIEIERSSIEKTLKYISIDKSDPIYSEWW